MDMNILAVILAILLIIFAPTFLMMYYTNKKMNSFLGFLGIFIVVVGSVSVMPLWIEVIGILIIGLFFYRFIMARRSATS
jgi:hypothetical protein